jgi:hypothetical protein
MEDQTDAEILVLENIAALDEACKLVDKELDVKILTALDEYIEQVIEPFKEYGGIFEFHEDNETWFTPNKWLVKDDNGDIGYQFFYCELKERYTTNSKDDNNFYVTSLIGSGVQQMCFAVTITPSHFSKLGARGCRSFIQSIFQDNSLSGQGVEYDSDHAGAIIIPFVVDLESLKTAYVDEDFTEVFAPVGKAIEKSMEVMKMFSDPLEELKRKYPQAED